MCPLRALDNSVRMGLTIPVVRELTNLADSDGGWRTREAWHAGFEGSYVRERATSTGVDGTHSELVSFARL